MCSRDTTEWLHIKVEHISTHTHTFTLQTKPKLEKSHSVSIVVHKHLRMCVCICRAIAFVKNNKIKEQEIINCKKNKNKNKKIDYENKTLSCIILDFFVISHREQETKILSKSENKFLFSGRDVIAAPICELLEFPIFCLFSCL